jgi:hypothetical protein
MVLCQKGVSLSEHLKSRVGNILLVGFLRVMYKYFAQIYLVLSFTMS